MKISQLTALGTASLLLAACGSTATPAAAPSQTMTGALASVSNSVVRLTGDAKDCGRREHGSGFVVGKDLVITNAHVVAGVTDVMVDGPATSKPLTGTVVYFDPNVDTALVRVPGLGLNPLTIGDALTAGSAAKLIGYPEGNSQVTADGSVVRTFSAATQDIYNSVDVTRELYEVSVTVNHGNSGGPLVDEQGVVHGMVFAKAPDKDATAYVLLPDAVNYVVTQGASATTALATKCIPN